MPWVSKLGGTGGNPNIYGYDAWGYPFVVEKIKQAYPDKPVYLNILPNHYALHESAFRLFLVQNRIYSIVPTNSRAWTIVGDRMHFDPKSACGPSCYLVKTGYTGFPLADQESRDNYTKLTDFLSKSGKYNLLGKELLPDNSSLLVYGRTF
jgi:hypothetical protein